MAKQNECREVNWNVLLQAREFIQVVGGDRVSGMLSVAGDELFEEIKTVIATFWLGEDCTIGITVVELCISFFTFKILSLLGCLC